MSENDILKTSEEIKKGKYKLLSKEKFSEKILLKIDMITLYLQLLLTNNKY